MRKVNMTLIERPPVLPTVEVRFVCPECGGGDIRAFSEGLCSFEIDEIDYDKGRVVFVETPHPTDWEHSYFQCHDCEARVDLPEDWEHEYR